MNKNTKAKFASAHKTFRAYKSGKSTEPPIARCTEHQPRKSTKPKVARTGKLIND